MKHRSAAQVTLLLSLLIVAAVGGVPVAYFWLQSAAKAATAARLDLVSCQHDLTEMADPTNVDGAVAADPADPEFNRRLRSAATVAGIPDEVVSIEPGVPRRIGETDFDQTLVSLRLNTVTLRQLITFLHQLSTRDPAVRAKILELSPPAEPAGSATAAVEGLSADENWSADVTLAYLSFVPRDTGAK